jgi:hypothetical protein
VVVVEVGLEIPQHYCDENAAPRDKTDYDGHLDAKLEDG